MHKYLTVKQAADLRGVSAERVRQWIRAERLPRLVDPNTGLLMVTEGAVIQLVLLPRGRKPQSALPAARKGGRDA